MSRPSTQPGSTHRVSSPSRNNNGADLRDSPPQEGPGALGDEKDQEIARLKRAFHDAVTENSNKKASAKTNT